MPRNQILKLFLVLASLGVIAILVWPWLPTGDLPSHRYIDERSFWGIPNALNVLSNFAFFVVAVNGIITALRTRSQFSEGFFYLRMSFSLAVLWTCFGSAYFHWDPTPETLVWDRLPMTLAFSSIIALVVCDRLREEWGLWVLVVLAPIGILTVFGYREDWISFRFYLLFQLLTVLFVGVTVVFFRVGRMSSLMLGAGVLLYVVAKLCEAFDAQIMAVGNIVSGHTLKHLFAALAVYKILGFSDEV